MPMEHQQSYSFATKGIYYFLLCPPYKGVGRCLGPEGNGVSPGEGGEGGRAHQTGSEISHLAPARKEATWSRRKKERRARSDEKDPACTE